MAELTQIDPGGVAASQSAGSPAAGFLAPSLAALEVPHLFGTRSSGEPGDRDAEDPAARAARDAALCRALDRPRATLVGLRQVHGALVFDADGALPAEPPQADAVVTARADRLAVVRVADCVPVLLARADGGLVAAVHAGWRGLVAGVIAATLEHFGPAPVVAAIGPCLSRARFEVGPEVASAFRAVDLAAVVHAVDGARPHVDLRAAATLQLRRGGVQMIDGARACTWEDEALFFSYRRDVTHRGGATTGRQYAVIGARGGAGSRT